MSGHSVEKDAGRAEAFAAVEEELSAYTSRGSVVSPQWPWHALDRARRRILPPGGGRAQGGGQ